MKSTLRRWAAIALPIVLVLRVLLMIVQMHDRHDAHDGAPHGGESPVSFASGQVLRFDRGDPNLAAPAASRTLTVALLRQDGRFVGGDAGCSLDPAAMAGEGGGTLTLVATDGDGHWVADWSGGATVALGQVVTDPDPDARYRAMQAVLEHGADCGRSAQVEMSRAELVLLSDLLAGRPAAEDAPPPREGLGLRLPGATASP